MISKIASMGAYFSVFLLVLASFAYAAPAQYENTCMDKEQRQILFATQEIPLPTLAFDPCNVAGTSCTAPMKYCCTTAGGGSYLYYCSSTTGEYKYWMTCAAGTSCKYTGGNADNTCESNTAQVRILSNPDKLEKTELFSFTI